MSKITINDVADHAGVSFKTVSRIINNEPGVRQSTREKVLKSIKALNYHPSLSARSLAGKRAYIIGLIYDNPNAYYIMSVQNGVLAECEARGYSLLIHPCDFSSGEVFDNLIKFVERSRLSGLVLTPPVSEDVSIHKKLKELKIQAVSIVSASTEPAGLAPSIYVMDKEAAYDVTMHLLDLGHKRISFICGNTEHRSTPERLQGFKDAHREFGVEVIPELIIQGEYSFESGTEVGERLLTMNEYNRPTAIFASNDEIAAGVLFVARKLGISVPRELSIAGFEDSPFSRQTWPRLTTAQQPLEQIAKQASIILIDHIRIATGLEVTEEHNKGFKPELVIRESTGPAPS